MCSSDEDCEPAEECTGDVCVPREVEACSAADPCPGGYFCENEACVLKWELGHVCSDATPCASGHCVEEVCCDGACDAACESCLALLTAGVDGACDPILVGTDPDVECGGTACTGGGACFAKGLGVACDEAYECVSGFCETVCVVAPCGDGAPDPGEECDDGINDGSYGTCNPDCTVAAYCGDGAIDFPEESCDDGQNDGSYDGCMPDCSDGPRCGDGNRDDLFEDCDDGNLIDDGNGCDEACAQNSVCGNTTIEDLFEECDPPDAFCDANCRDLNYECGDGSVDPGEDCDDFNVSNGDGCSIGCALEPGWLCPGVPSSCTRYIMVDASAAAGGDGTTWGSAYDTLSAGVAEAALLTRPAEIWVAAGTYVPGATRASTFEMHDDVAWYGGFDGTETDRAQRDPLANATILSGEIGAVGTADNIYHVVTAATVNATAVLDGFTIQSGRANGGSPDANGAGLYAYNAAATVRGCTFALNSANGDGGGVYNSGGNLVLSDVVFMSNSAARGGGLFTRAATVDLSGAVFTRFAALVPYDGGIYNEAGTLRVDDAAFSTSGAAVSSTSGRVHISRSVFNAMAANQLSGIVLTGSGTGAHAGKSYVVSCTFLGGSLAAQTGGSALLNGASMHMINSLVRGYGNAGYPPSGAPISATASTLEISSSTVTGNYAVSTNSNSAGVAVTSSTQLTIDNSIIWGNLWTIPTVATDVPQSLYGDADSTINSSFSNIGNPLAIDGTDINNISVDPDFTSTSDLHLQDGSLCIDAGDPTGPPARDWLDLDGDGISSGEELPYDIEGASRVQSRLDMGAYER